MASGTDFSAIADPTGPSARLELAIMLLRSVETRQDQFFHAVSLVDSAADAGDPEATALQALFEAMGAARPQSWDRAFDSLQLAAERGSTVAQRQLAFLAMRSTNSAVAEADAWTDMRRSISLERLLHHGERQAFASAPRIRVIESFASPDECRWLIKRARHSLKSALVFDLHGSHVLDPGRSNKGTVFTLPDMDLIIEILRTRISAATHIPVSVFEPTQVLHYSAGQEFKRHFDYLEPGNPHHSEQLRSHGQRIATFLIYLNEDFEGGETEFSQIGLRYRGKTGDAIFWANCDMEGRPDSLTLHAGLPPTAGAKWILSQWIRDRTPPVS